MRRRWESGDQMRMAMGDRRYEEKFGGYTRRIGGFGKADWNELAGLVDRYNKETKPKKISDTFCLGHYIPPLVEGNLIGELRVSIPALYLHRRFTDVGFQNSSRKYVVKLQPWGQEGHSIIFHPPLTDIANASNIDINSSSQCIARMYSKRSEKAKLHHTYTMAIFPVRASAKKAIRYLCECRELVFKVIIDMGSQFKQTEIGIVRVPLLGCENKIESPKMNTVIEGHYAVEKKGRKGEQIGCLYLSVILCIGQRHSKLLKLAGTVTQSKLHVKEVRKPVSTNHTRRKFNKDFQDRHSLNKTTVKRGSSLNELNALGSECDKAVVSYKSQPLHSSTAAGERTEWTVENAIQVIKQLRRNRNLANHVFKSEIGRIIRNSELSAEADGVVLTTSKTSEKDSDGKLPFNGHQGASNKGILSAVLRKALKLRNELRNSETALLENVWSPTRKSFESGAKGLFAKSHFGAGIDKGNRDSNISDTKLTAALPENDLSGAVLPLVAEITGHLRNVNSVSLSIVGIDYPPTFSKTFSDKIPFLECSLEIPASQSSSGGRFKRCGLSETRILRGSISLKDNEMHEPWRTSSNKWKQMKLQMASTWEVKFDRELIQQWMNGVIMIRLYAISSNVPKVMRQDLRIVGQGAVPLRLPILSGNMSLEASVPILSTDFRISPNQMASLQIEVEFHASLDSKASTSVNGVKHEATTWVVNSCDAMNERENKIIGSASHHLVLSIVSTDPRTVFVDFRHRVNRQGEYVRITKDCRRAFLPYCKGKLPNPFVIEVYNSSGEHTGLVKLPKSLSLPFSGSVDVRETLTNDYLFSVRLDLRESKIGKPIANNERPKNASSSRNIPHKQGLRLPEPKACVVNSALVSTYQNLKGCRTLEGALLTRKKRKATSYGVEFEDRPPGQIKKHEYVHDFSTSEPPKPDHETQVVGGYCHQFIFKIVGVQNFENAVQVVAKYQLPFRDSVSGDAKEKATFELRWEKDNKTKTIHQKHKLKNLQGTEIYELFPSPDTHIQMDVVILKDMQGCSFGEAHDPQLVSNGLRAFVYLPAQILHDVSRLALRSLSKDKKLRSSGRKSCVIGYEKLVHLPVVGLPNGDEQQKILLLIQYSAKENIANEETCTIPLRSSQRNDVTLSPLKRFNQVAAPSGYPSFFLEDGLQNKEVCVCFQIAHVAELKQLFELLMKNQHGLDRDTLPMMNPSISIVLHATSPSGAPCEMSTAFKTTKFYSGSDFEAITFSMPAATLFTAMHDAEAEILIRHNSFVTNDQKDFALIGRVVVPLQGLFLDRMGLRGHFPVECPGLDSFDRVLLEVAVFFERYRDVGNNILSAESMNEKKKQKNTGTESDCNTKVYDSPLEPTSHSLSAIFSEEGQRVSPETSISERSSNKIESTPRMVNALLDEPTIDLRWANRLEIVVDSIIHISQIKVNGSFEIARPYVTFEVQVGKDNSRYEFSTDPAMPHAKKFSIPISEEAGTFPSCIHFDVFHKTSPYLFESLHPRALGIHPERDSGGAPPGIDFDPYEMQDRIGTYLKRTPDKKTTDDDIYIGTAVVDISPLVLKFSEIDGWYHIIDSNQRRVGQIKVLLRPEGESKSSVNNSSHLLGSLRLPTSLPEQQNFNNGHSFQLNPNSVCENAHESVLERNNVKEFSKRTVAVDLKEEKHSIGAALDKLLRLDRQMEIRLKKLERGEKMDCCSVEENNELSEVCSDSKTYHCLPKLEFSSPDSHLHFCESEREISSTDRKQPHQASFLSNDFINQNSNFTNGIDELSSLDSPVTEESNVDMRVGNESAKSSPSSLQSPRIADNNSSVHNHPDTGNRFTGECSNVVIGSANSGKVIDKNLYRDKKSDELCLLDCDDFQSDSTPLKALEPNISSNVSCKSSGRYTSGPKTKEDEGISSTPKNILNDEDISKEEDQSVSFSPLLVDKRKDRWMSPDIERLVRILKNSV